MFDMGFTEMMLIGIVALIVIGPERLPGVARTAGKYLGRLKRFMTTIKADVEQELRADELRQILADQQKELDTLKDSINVAGKEIEQETSAIDDVRESISTSVDEVVTGADADASSDRTEPAVSEPATATADVKSSDAKT